ncbi:MAG: HIT domain-containing protein [Micropruina sp.]|uniref:HIT family protein n=1 Tax=Micropruina sp. TaxID=2737536 RepID=UPI0039E6155E
MACLFCSIVAGDIPARRIYADDHAIAFLDINPWKRGHTLVIPRRHVDDILDADEALTEIAPAIAATSRLLTERLAADGLNLLANAGAVAGQEVFHLHVHLVPRYADDPGLRALFDRDAGIDLDEVHAAITGG